MPWSSCWTMPVPPPPWAPPGGRGWPPTSPGRRAPTPSTACGEATLAETPLSIVVATRDRPELLGRCLAALATSVRSGDEVLVVDSASREPAAVAAVAAEA